MALYRPNTSRIFYKELALAIFTTVLLFTLYKSDVTRVSPICEVGHNWTSDIPNIRSLVTTTEALSLPECSPFPLLLLIIVCSAAPNFAARQSIRRTWGNEQNFDKKMRLFFLIGRSKNAMHDRFIFEEKQDYSDIIHYEFQDTYFNLTLKSVLMLHFIHYSCANYRYVLKVDDDTFVNIENLKKSLLLLNNTVSLCGNLIEDAVPEKDVCSKWYVPKNSYTGSTYPNYLSGSGYILSQNAIAPLYEKSLTIPFYPFEDIFITGICAMASGLVPQNLAGFSYKRPSFEPCILKHMLTGHRITAKEHHTVWNIINDPTLICS